VKRHGDIPLWKPKCLEQEHKLLKCYAFPPHMTHPTASQQNCAQTRQKELSLRDKKNFVHNHPEMNSPAIFYICLSRHIFNYGYAVWKLHFL